MTSQDNKYGGVSLPLHCKYVDGTCVPYVLILLWCLCYGQDEEQSSGDDYQVTAHRQGGDGGE